MKHCILAKYKEEIDLTRKAELMAEIQGVFQPLKAVPGIHEVEVFPNIIDRSNRYDILIRIDMDKEALQVYDVSVPHKIWKEKYGLLLEKKAIFDYEESDT